MLDRKRLPDVFSQFSGVLADDESAGGSSSLEP